MRFRKVSLEALLSEIRELPSEWMDESARKVLDVLREVVQGFRAKGRTPTRGDLEEMFRRHSAFLDICRLFIGLGQEPVAHMICDELGGSRMTWARLRSLASQQPERMAKVMIDLGVSAKIQEHLERAWQAEDILIERYRMSRGRAIAGQKRGRGLEDEVETILHGLKIPYARGVTFTGRKGVKAKCDFAVPTKDHPKVVLEAKGFEATGSKLTDFIGDVLKIGQAKEYHTYFFLITDGRGWYNRQSDLQKIVEYHHEGLIDMVYTRRRLKQLGQDVRHIYENE